MQLRERGPIVRCVLDDIQTRDQVEALVRPRQLLEAADHHLADAAGTCHFGGRFGELDARHRSVAH